MIEPTTRAVDRSVRSYNHNHNHNHKRGHPLRAFVDRPGVWVQRHGDWNRPLHVWLYRGAWRVICWPCATPLRSGDDLYDDGYRTQAAAFDAAVTHCAACEYVVLSL